LAHSLLAIRNGQPVRSITLFIFGGVSQIEKEGSRPNAEIAIALIGPLSSFLLAAVFKAIWNLSASPFPVVASVAGWLASINLVLGMFNLLPGLPLGGGRVLRGVIWRLTGDESRATRLASNAGRALGDVLILLGVVLALRFNQLVGGIWIGFIGFFLVNSAEMSVMQMEMPRTLAGTRAGQVMMTDCPSVPPGISLAEFVEQYLLLSGRRCYVVGDVAAPRGLITQTDVRAVPRDQWRTTSVQAAMRPIESLHAVAPESDLREVVQLLDANQISQVVVMQEGRLLGMIGHEQLMWLPRNRMELAAS
jgi:Zn-dependent protease